VDHVDDFDRLPVLSLFILQLIKEIKYRLDRVGRSAPSTSAAEYRDSIVEVK
jgi:hypothetical protein